MTAYGRTWPMVRMSMINVRVNINLLVDLESSTSIAEQMRNIEAEWKARMPPEAQIEIQEADSYALSPEDQLEHDRLAEEALQQEAA